MNSYEFIAAGLCAAVIVHNMGGSLSSLALSVVFYNTGGGGPPACMDTPSAPSYGQCEHSL